MEQIAAPPQGAALQQLAGIAFPRILIAFEANQAAQKKNGQGYVWIHAKEEMMYLARHESLPLLKVGRIAARSEERRVGKECVSTCRSGWSPYIEKKKKKIK